MQLVGNLLTNAIKYSPAGGTITVSARATAAGIEFDVADHGIGIAGDQQDRVFGEFVRVASSDTREITGTGLGLAVCRDIARAHGGDVTIESELGEGATFRVRLPRAVPETLAA